ncbi:MAG: EAL domain-containing protein, partial [Acidobacteriota bacterium]
VGGHSFSVGKADIRLVGLAIATVFLSSALRIQMPRHNILLTISDALIILSMLIYGGEVAVTGVKLSLEDFGTGHSSLSYLHRFAVDKPKVDRSFVSTMEDGTENGEIVRTVVSLAKSLRLHVIAEGIETAHKLETLQSLGCELGQGYLFARPFPAGEIEALMADSNLWQDLVSPNRFKVPATQTKFPQYTIAQ